MLLDLVGQRFAPGRGQIIELTEDRDTENVEGLSDEGPACRSVRRPRGAVRMIG